jgi:hypothetical protein
MPDFYYQTNREKQAYRIDKVSQQILVYLYSNQDARLEQIVNGVSVSSKSEVNIRLDEVLGSEEAGLTTESNTAQATFDGSQFEHYQLTEVGENFVMKNKPDLSMPADFKELEEEINMIQKDIINTKESLHQIDADELSEYLSGYAERLDSVQNHISNYS